ncbi:hypothetical protein BDF19DRAFT_419459 [Syncephalis fuscata]|nr:hypothetical protein BDF19DRAFT_419459 [Syncephalis fuscata]
MHYFHLATASSFNYATTSFSCLCDNASIRGRWMMINYLEPALKDMGKFSVLITRVFDLANGQRCMGAITTHYGEAFLLRVTEETATIFIKSLHYSYTTITVKWNVWEFSNCHLGYGPRCLMQGEIRFKKYEGYVVFVKKLDDNRVLIEHNFPFNANMLNEHRGNETGLAMISTKCSYSNVCIKDQQQQPYETKLIWIPIREQKYQHDTSVKEMPLILAYGLPPLRNWDHWELSEIFKDWANLILTHTTHAYKLW